MWIDSIGIFLDFLYIKKFFKLFNHLVFPLRQNEVGRRNLKKKSNRKHFFACIFELIYQGSKSWIYFIRLSVDSFSVGDFFDIMLIFFRETQDGFPLSRSQSIAHHWWPNKLTTLSSILLNWNADSLKLLSILLPAWSRSAVVF